MTYDEIGEESPLAYINHIGRKVSSKPREENMITFQEILKRLSSFWEAQGCIIHQGYDSEVGAGTFNPATFLRCLGPEPYKAAYIEPCRRPTDGRYGENPNRVQHYFQFQVMLKPSPENIQELYLKSLEAVGFDLKKHDIRFVHDDWEQATIGAWGLGWEVWMDGMEISQFTYFQCVGGVDLKPVTGEITYGTERLALYLQKKESIFDIQWNESLTYGDIYKQNEIDFSQYNFEQATASLWFSHFNDFEQEAKKLIALGLPVPAYDFVMKASHAFNILGARGLISVTERAGYIARIRDLAKGVAEGYLSYREKLGFPLLHKFKETAFNKDGLLLPIPSELLHSDPTLKEKFLLEIRSEELPASFVTIGSENLKKGIKNLLDEEGLHYEKITTYGTPRRLSVIVEGLVYGKEEEAEEKKGPSLSHGFDADGIVTSSGAGFFRAIRKEPLTLDAIKEGKDKDLFIKNIKGCDYLFGNVTKPRVSTAIILQEKLPKLIENLEFPKKMHWGNSSITYARPLKSIVALFGKTIISFQLENYISNNSSCGHPQLQPFHFTITSPEEYLKTLKEYFITADIEERKKEIDNQLNALEKKESIKVIQRERVIAEVVNLVEWPKVCLGSFEDSFLELPREVLISEMVEHQKYFPVEDLNGKLLNMFVITADTEPTEQIKKGNEKVLSARLNDGAFLYKQGLKEPLQNYNEKLKSVMHQKVLGTVYDKVLRLQKLSLSLQKLLNISSSEKAARAALLSKADLATEMVFEFPDLQGTIGKYYSKAAGEDSEVSEAIEEQWYPRSEKGKLPSTETGVILSLADKLDNLVGCYLAGLKPTSSSDPYALRRQVLGMIKILIQGCYFLPMDEVLRNTFENFPESLRDKKEPLLKEIELFIESRIKTIFLEMEFAKDVIEAALTGGVKDIYEAYCKVLALREFRRSGEKFKQLFEVYKRAKGQISNQIAGEIKPNLLREKAEISLYDDLLKLEPIFLNNLKRHDYQGAYEQIASLQEPLAKLFDEVKILDENEEIRKNRISLLKRVFGLFERLLDFSKIQ